MNTLNFSAMTDTELQNLIEQAGKEQENRIEAKMKKTEQDFWKVAEELRAIYPDYELFDTCGYPITISDIIFNHKEEDEG